jgi:hypothetical protein
VGLEEFLKLEIGKSSSLRETVHAFAYFRVYKSVDNLVLQAVQLDDFVREHVLGDADIFVLVQFAAKVEIFQVHSHELGARGSDYAVEHEFGGG